MQVARCATGIKRPCAPKATSRGRLQVCAASDHIAFNVGLRPYTLRAGDTLESIADKRDLTLKDILVVNADINPDNLKAGQTILLPAHKLSKRDREILGGIGLGYRVYPVRAGETLDDIISKRNITREEMEGLNPKVNLDKLKANQILNLPPGRFTVREREMLVGSGILPNEFFAAAKNPFVWGIGALLLVCGFVLAWQKFYRDEDEEWVDEEPEKKLA